MTQFMIPPGYSEILTLIQALGGGLVTPALIVYLILRIRRTNEKMEEQGVALKQHVDENKEKFIKSDNKIIGLTTFLIRTNGKLSGRAKKELTNLLTI